MSNRSSARSKKTTARYHKKWRELWTFERIGVFLQKTAAKLATQVNAKKKNLLINYYILYIKMDIIDNVYLDYINFFQRLFGRLERIDMNLIIFYFL